MGYVLQHTDKVWVQKTIQKIFISALGGSSVEFEQALPVAVLALQASLGDAPLIDFLFQRGERLLQDAGALRGGRGEDSWAFNKRHMLALAQAFACLNIAPNIAPDRILDLLESTARIAQTGFAGYNASAMLALAETVRVCGVAGMPDEATQVASALDAAQEAAHNIQDPTFCARITARVNAMRNDWYGAFNLQRKAQRLRETPQARDYAALHFVGHEYIGRNPDSLPLPDEMKAANTLHDLANVFDRPVSALMSMNREENWSETTSLPKGTQVRIPDPGFAPHLAARLAAEALVDPNLDADSRLDLIRSLVPGAVASPTALDAVLARLALAWGMGHPEGITPPVIGALREEAPLSDEEHQVPPIGELIG
jgi:hypothetical protein